MAPHHDSSGDLLLGLLALRQGLIEPTQILAALDEWLKSDTRSLSTILAESGVLDASARRRLESLALAHLESRKEGPELSLTVAYEGAGAAVADQETASHSSAPLTRGDQASARYQIVRSHARGGLGEVFLAFDPELKRQVALKVIQAAHAHDPVSQARFLLEAEVTGRLEHPGIVPVYGLGRDAGGRPFYVMRFIEGETLKTAILRFHGPEGRALEPGDREVAFRRLLQSYVAACNAVAYAHSRGVVHRDLKPENIMLGPFGETLVVDWGIVKTLEGREPAVIEKGPPGREQRDPALTLPGSAVGTPRYMSPEQASGRLDDVGIASDVYGLGATLYCLLVGHAPFPESDVTEVLDRVRRGIFPAPRRLRREVDPVLEAVCLKAMALKPEERFDSPQNLAREIEQWLADVRYRGDQMRAFNEVRGSFSRLCIERAQNLLIRERHDEGMLWLARALESLPADSPGLERVVRSNLGAWHARTRLLERSMKQNGAVHAVAFSPDGHRLATAGQDHTARLWDVATGRELVATAGHTGSALSLAFSPDGSTLATAGEDGALRLWDALSGEERARAIRQPGPIRSFQYSRDGKLLAAATRTAGPFVWCARTGKPVVLSNGPHELVMACVAFSRSGPWLAAACDDGRILCWNTDTRQALQLEFEHKAAVPSLVFHPDGKTLLTGCLDCKARLWELDSAVCLREFTMPAEVRLVAFNPAGSVIATACGNGSARLWNPDRGHPIGEPLVHDATIECLAFSPDGETLATAGKDRTTRLWDTSTGLPVGPPLEHRGVVTSLAFSADGKRLATACADGFGRIWRVAPQIPGSVERVSCWVRVATDKDFDSGDAITKLDSLVGWELRRRLHVLGGPPPGQIERWHRVTG